MEKNFRNMNMVIGILAVIVLFFLCISFLDYITEKNDCVTFSECAELAGDMSKKNAERKESTSACDFYTGEYNTEEFNTEEVKTEENHLEERMDNNNFKYELGYDLPVDKTKNEEAEADCRKIMESIQEIYINADKGNTKNVVISDEAAEQMLDVIAKTGCPAIAGQLNSDMRNDIMMEMFLTKAANDEACEQITYEILTGGGIHRKQYCFDGTDMYVFGTICTWNTKYKPVVNATTCYRLKEWEYTEKGWFIFEYCVPEPPAVSERINGTVMIRVKPLDEKYREIAEAYLSPIGYQGNNLLCSDWDADHLENLDYNGLFQYLYTIEYGEYMDSDRYVKGIPKDEFENMMTKYLPVTQDQLKQYAAYDPESQIYHWQILGCGNYTPSLFGTSTPEITDMVENEDGTTTLTIDAVCEMLGKDAVITHVLTVRFEENGDIVFLGNRVMDDGLQKIPTYEYRFEDIRWQG